MISLGRKEDRRSKHRKGRERYQVVYGKWKLDVGKWQLTSCERLDCPYNIRNHIPSSRRGCGRKGKCGIDVGEKEEEYEIHFKSVLMCR